MLQTPLALSDAQYASLGQSNGRVNLWEGSIRSGKTFVSFFRFLAFLATYEGAGSFVMVGKSRDTLYRNIFEPIEKDPALEFLQEYVRYRQGATVAHIMGIRVNVVGANDAKAEMKIRGMTVAGAYGDEITVWSEDFFKQLLGRMSPPNAQFFGTTNPDNPQHWLKTDYIDRYRDGILPNWRVFHFTLDDNDTLTDEYRDSLKREYTGLWYKRFILGLWVSAEGSIYQDWDEETHIIPFDQTPPVSRVLAVGMDYGTTNATAAVMLAITDEHDNNGRPAPRLIILDEFRYDSKQTGHRLSPARQATLIHEWLLDTEHAPYDLDAYPEYVVLDPSASPLAESLSDIGVNAWDADNNVADGISDIASLLATNRMIVTDRCKGLIKEAPGYVWDSTASAHGQDKPVKENDHSMDAWRYAVRSTKQLWYPALARAYGPM